MSPGETLYNLHYLLNREFPGVAVCYADPAQPPTTAGEELDDLSVDRKIMISPS